MSAVKLRQEIKKRIDILPEKRLRVAADFLAYLEEREDNAATRELLAIPGFVKAFSKARRSVHTHSITSVDRLRRKHS